MKKHLEDKLSMALATQQAMNDNAPLWSSVTAIGTAVTTLGTKIASIKGIRGVQESDTKGVAIDKGSKKEDAINLALPIIGSLVGFAKATNNSTLLKKIDYSRTQLERARDTILADQLKIVRDEANNNLPALAPYNVTSAKVNALSAAIAGYEVMIPKPRVALNVRKNATEALDKLFNELDLPLEILDGLVGSLQTTQPAFFETYKNSRIIVDSSSGGSGVKGIVRDKITGAPLEGVTVSINAPQHRARINAISPTRKMTVTTNADGHYEMRRLPAGHYTLTMEMVGYNSLNISATIDESGIGQADGEMNRTATPSA